MLLIFVQQGLSASLLPHWLRFHLLRGWRLGLLWFLGNVFRFNYAISVLLSSLLDLAMVLLVLLNREIGATKLFSVLLQLLEEVGLLCRFFLLLFFELSSKSFGLDSLLLEDLTHVTALGATRPT
jgi:hypothetical protein